MIKILNYLLVPIISIGMIFMPINSAIAGDIVPAGTTLIEDSYVFTIDEANSLLKRLEELDRLIQSSTLGFDNNVYERGLGRRTQGDIYEERNALIAEISARAVARQSEQERQERGSKGSTKPGPFEYAHGGSVMSFVKPKSRY